MAEEGKPDEQEVKVRRSVNKMVLGIGLAMIAIIGAAVFFAFKFVEDERSRDLAAWQVRLGIVADSRTAAVNEWAEQQFGVMRELAENASLQLYMTELALAEGKTADVTDEAAQAGYYGTSLSQRRSAPASCRPRPWAKFLPMLKRQGSQVWPWWMQTAAPWSVPPACRRFLPRLSKPF